MTPLPKQKMTKARGRKRRSHEALTKVTLTECPQCGSKKLPHQVCHTCGTYKGQQVLVIAAKKTK